MLLNHGPGFSFPESALWWCWFILVARMNASSYNNVHPIRSSAVLGPRPSDSHTLLSLTFQQWNNLVWWGLLLGSWSLLPKSVLLKLDLLVTMETPQKSSLLDMFSKFKVSSRRTPESDSKYFHVNVDDIERYVHISQYIFSKFRGTFYM